jgi:hypothetical protein
MHLDAIRQQGDNRRPTETHPARQRRLRHRRLTATITKPSFIDDEQDPVKKNTRNMTPVVNFVLYF